VTASILISLPLSYDLVACWHGCPVRRLPLPDRRLDKSVRIIEKLPQRLVISLLAVTGSSPYLESRSSVALGIGHQERRVGDYDETERLDVPTVASNFVSVRSHPGLPYEGDRLQAIRMERFRVG
jgi:hypothetical protein